jgi:hypothetical protein
VHDDPRDAAVRATARRCTLSLKQRITSRTRYAKKITEAYHSRSAATTDARSCIVVDVVAIRNSFGFVDRRLSPGFGGIRFRARARRAGGDLAMWYIIFR